MFKEQHITYAVKDDDYKLLAYEPNILKDKLCYNTSTNFHTGFWERKWTAYCINVKICVAMNFGIHINDILRYIYTLTQH